MKSKVQKQLEALERIDKNIARLEESLREYKQKAKAWTRPVITAKSTSVERLYIMSLPKENPFLNQVAAAERHIKRLEKERQHVYDIIRDRTATVRYV
jgi:hypothetical protein